ncbi:MAG: hypothetical protein IJP70_08165 [Bacteroidales bacterium]|nr:hypothetical protein [Bacteroidales bacterium]
MKKILLSLAALLCAGSMWAQTDVTSTYLTNADFSAGTVIDNNVCTYGKDMAANGTTYYGAQAISGWTNASVGSTADGYDNCTLAGALFEYGSASWVAGAGNTAPATDPNGNAGKAAGLCAVWGGSIQYTQAVTLPAGSYTIKFNVFNTTSGSGNSSGIITTNLFGFIEDGGTTHYAPNNTFAIGQWVNVAVTFELAAETAGKISMGYVGPSGNAAMPHLFVDNVKILQNEVAEDCTNKVKTTGWTGAGDGYQGGSINTARQYGDKTIGRHIYQTVSGLDNGMYEVAFYALSQKEWNGSLTNDAGDVAYVFTEGAYEIKEWINARARNSYPGDDNVGIYTISGVKVTDGSLTLGMGLAKADLTEWHHVQIKSLVRTGDIVDLTLLTEAYETALANAKAVDQSKKMATSILAALQSAISTYDEGNVNETSASELNTATAALASATTNANTSIASYSIIASGSISDSSIEGWSDTGTGSEFRVNTWSTEGNTDGSGMTTPFIQTWINGSSTLKDGQAYYTLAGLEPGETYYAQALVRAYSEAGNTPNGPTFFVNDTEQDMTEVGTAFTNGNKKGYYGMLGAAATVGDDGKITLGVKISSANYNWVAFKNVSIQSMDDAFNAAVAKVTVLEGTIPTAAYNTAYAVVTANSGANYPTTAAGFETAIAAIEAAATSASVFVAPYASFQTLKTSANALVSVENNNSDANSTLASAISAQNTAVEAATTAAAITTATSTLKTAMITYVGTADPAEGKLFDLSFLLTNPSFEGFADWGAPADQGWATDIPRTNLGDYNNFACRTTGAPGGSLVSKFVERYTSNACTTANLYALYQTINLPAGNYRFEALSCANEATTVLMAAGDATGDAVTATTLNTTYKVNFTVTTAGGTKMGIKLGNDNISNWQCIASPALYKTDVTKSTVTVSEAGFATYVSNYNLNFSATAIEAYAVTVTKKGVATLTKLNQVPANTPVLLYAEGGKTEDIPVLASAEAVTDNDLVAGTGAAVATIDGEYTNMILNKVDGNVGFYFAAGQTVAANRAYLHIATTLAPDAEAGAPMVIEFADEVTGIEAVEAETSANGIYNLAGQRVAKAQKGLYIVNGKKVIVK